jgi:hypothetical protein
MLKFMKNTILSYFISLGLLTFVMLIINYFSKDLINMNGILRVMMWTLLALSIAGSLIFKTGISYRSLWIRRIIMIFISIICSIVFLWTFGALTGQSFTKYILFVSLATAIGASALYLTADFITQKNIRKINEKLKEFQKTE